jgi:predicted nucleotidyltransferase component of viral defense system
MKNDSVKNMAASVRDKLLQMARQSGKPFQSLLIQYGLERFLYRLSQSSFKEEFILKGGLLLVGMGFPLARTTRDIDFLGLMKQDADSVSAAIQQIGKLVLNDGIVYEFNDLNIEVMSADSEYPGMRLMFTASLGKAIFPMQIDVGFGDAIIPAAKEMTFPTLLDMEPPVVKAYSIETIVAEKFEAALDLADLNSRMKDFYDMWILSQTYSFQGIALQESIMATCQRRKTALNSSAEVFTKEFAGHSDKRTQWISFLRKNKMLDISEDFSAIMEEIRTFLQPIANAIEKGVRFEKVWPPKGAWQKTI